MIGDRIRAWLGDPTPVVEQLPEPPRFYVVSGFVRIGEAASGGRIVGIVDGETGQIHPSVPAALGVLQRTAAKWNADPAEHERTNFYSVPIGRFVDLVEVAA